MLFPVTQHEGTIAPITCCNIVQRFIISIHLHGFFFFLSLCELSPPLLSLWKAKENIDEKKLQVKNLLRLLNQQTSLDSGCLMNGSFVSTQFQKSQIGVNDWWAITDSHFHHYQTVVVYSPLSPEKSNAIYSVGFSALNTPALPEVYYIQMTYDDDKDSKTVLLVSLVFKVTFSAVTGALLWAQHTIGVDQKLRGRIHTQLLGYVPSGKSSCVLQDVYCCKCLQAYYYVVSRWAF